MSSQSSEKTESPVVSASQVDRYEDCVECVYDIN